MSALDKQKKFAVIWRSLGVWIIVILIALILAVFTDSFLTRSNLINVIRQNCVTGIAALGVTFVVLCGEIDLSQGTLAALSGCMSALLMTKYNVSIFGAVCAALLVGVVSGLFIGFVVTYVRVPAFIATLGMQYAFNGITLLITGSQPIIGLPREFVFLGRGYWGIIPVPVIIMMSLFIAAAFVLKYFKFGRDVLATGENQVAARLSGIKVNKTRMLVFVISSVMASLAGAMLMARLSSGQPTAGSDLSLQALSAVYVGSGGGVLTTLAGVCIIGLINNGLNLLKVPSYWQYIALGCIIIVAVAIDKLRSDKS